MANALEAGWTALVAIVLLGSSVPAFAQEKINVGVISYYAPMAPVYAAEELGLCKKNGVSAEITSFRGGTPAQEALVVGAADIIPGSPMLAAIALKKGVKEVVVAPVTNGPVGWHIVVRMDSPIKSVKELEGKDVGVSAVGGLSDNYILYAAQHAGVQVNRIPVGSGGLIPALMGKQIDAAVMPPPVSFQVLLSKDARSIYDIGKEIGTTSLETWVASPAFIERHPKAIESFLRSIYQALDYMKNNREFGVAYLKKFTGGTDDKIVNAQFDQVLMEMPTAARIDPKSLDASLGFAKTVGAITSLPAVGQIYSDRFGTIDAH